MVKISFNNKYYKLTLIKILLNATHLKLDVLFQLELKNNLRFRHDAIFLEYLDKVSLK